MAAPILSAVLQNAVVWTGDPLQPKLERISPLAGAKRLFSGRALFEFGKSLAKLALVGTEFECVNDSLVGPSLFGFSMEDPGAAARIFKDFAKENEAFEVKALAVSGQILGADQLDVLAKLPTRDQALSILMSVMKAPVTKLVQTMNEVPGKLVRTLAAVRDQKEAAA